MTQPDLQAVADRTAELMRELMAQGYSVINAIVMAGDMVSAERIDELVRQGEKPQDLVWMIGSYARFDWAVQKLPRQKFFEILPALWVGSDPDDTNPEYLNLWREARARNKGRVITDGKPLPKGSTFTVYRGQVGDAKGFAWSLDRAIAEKFAKSGGGRGFVTGGKVLTRTVRRADIIAYLTSRNESEVILNC